MWRRWNRVETEMDPGSKKVWRTVLTKMKLCEKNMSAMKAAMWCRQNKKLHDELAIIYAVLQCQLLSV